MIPQVVSAGLLGCPYLVADMVGGGLEVSFVGKKIDEKLFVRSAALQSLMPMMQFSLLPTRRLSPEGVKLCRATSGYGTEPIAATGGATTSGPLSVLLKTYHNFSRLCAQLSRRVLYNMCV